MNQGPILAADGVARRLFSVDDLDRMVAAGIIGHDERIEVVDGLLIPMAARGVGHEIIKRFVNMKLVRSLPEGLSAAQGAGWRVSQMLYLEPDFLVTTDAAPFPTMPGEDVLLAIEVADSSLGYDLGLKSHLYAAEGVREYWVVDAERRQLHVHLRPTADGYENTRVHPADATVVPCHIPGFALRLGDLPGE